MTTLASPRSITVSLATSGFLVVVAVAATRTSTTMPLLAVSALGVVAFVLRSHPGPAISATLGMMALPYAWSPHVPKMGVGFGIVASILLIAAFFADARALQVEAIDIVVVVISLTPPLIELAEAQPHISEWLSPSILLPYFAFRCILENPKARAAFAPSVIAIGAVLAALGIWESLSGANPLVAAAVRGQADSHYATTWDVPLYRDGHLRAATTFGHPIAFGMFLLIPLAFALARPRRLNLAAAGLMIASLVMTYSRGPWLAAGVVLFFMIGWSRRRVAAALVCIGAIVPLARPIQHVIVQSGQASTEAGRDSTYRLNLMNEALHHLSLVGNPSVNLQASIPNFPDVTSWVAETAIRSGVAGLAALVALGWLAVRALRETRAVGDRDSRAAVVALVASLTGLLAVTLITSYQFFFWALLAYVAGARHSARRRQTFSETDAAVS